MKQERMKILNLLEEGKVNADEAAKLLEALSAADDHHGFISDETAERWEEGLGRFTKNVDHWAREFGHKVECAYKEMEPKLKQMSQNVLEKTACMMDEVSKSIHESVDNAKARMEEEQKAACCENDSTCCDGDKDDNTPKPN